MEALFNDLFEQIKDPFDPSRGVTKDNSLLLIYPPARELDFREHLDDKLVPRLRTAGIAFRVLDLGDFLFAGLDDYTVEDLRHQEFDDYRWMQQGLSQNVERRLLAALDHESAQVPGGTVIVSSTAALGSLLRFGELLRGLRHLPSRIAIAFPGEERGGKLHFLNHPDGGNYLALKLTSRER